MSIMRRWFPSFDGSAHVSPYLYVAPKRRWWPTLLAFAAGGVCVLALLGPSQKASVEKTQRPLVFQVRPGDAVAAKDLASSPPAAAAESGRDLHANSATASAEPVTPEPAPVPQRPNTGAPARAVASVEAGNVGVPPETGIEATTRPTVSARRHARDRRPAKSYASTPARHRVAKKSRPHEAPSEGYAYDYSGDRRYRFAGERVDGSYSDGGGGYGQRGGWFAEVN